MKKIKFSSYFLFISFFTFITVFIVIIQKSYNNLMGPIKKVETSSYQKIIDTSLDLEILDQIEKRPITFDETDPNVINYIISSPPSLIPSSSSADTL